MKTVLKSIKSKWKSKMLNETVPEKLMDFLPILNDIEIMRDEPSIEPCYEVNPELWRLFCKLNNREFAPNHVWSEMDVVLWIDDYTMKQDINNRLNKLNEMINEMKISRTKAAEIIGVQERTIYRWLSGSRPIPDFVLLSLHYANLLIKNRISIDPPNDLA